MNAPDLVRTQVRPRPDLILVQGRAKTGPTVVQDGPGRAG